jgi:pseudouridine synthase
VDVAKRRGGRGGPSSRVRGGPSTKKTRDASSDSESDAGGAHSTEGIRVNKCFRDFTSRRNADKLIESGRVTINGATASSGDRVVPGDVVELNGETVQWETLNVIRTEETNTAGPSTSSSTQFKYVKYWKPRGVTCTTDVRDGSNIIDAVGYTLARLFPVGRLDKDSTGLILLTSDGRLPNAALRSGRRHDKTYAVTVDTDIRPRDMKTLSKGVVISTPVQRDRVDRVLTARTLPCEINVTGRRTIEITLREGRNRQIRRMLDTVGYRVTDLHRVEIMGIGLGGLKKGRWVECDVTEMDIIMRCIRAAEEAGVEGDDEGEEEDS